MSQARSSMRLIQDQQVGEFQTCRSKESPIHRGCDKLGKSGYLKVCEADPERSSSSREVFLTRTTGRRDRGIKHRRRLYRRRGRAIRRTERRAEFNFGGYDGYFTCTD